MKRTYIIELNGCELIEIETEYDLYNEDEFIPNSFNDDLLNAYKKEYNEDFKEELLYWKVKGVIK